MISMIVAIDNKNGIGKDNTLLYNIKEDMHRFKVLTIGHNVIMGSKTFESLPNKKPLTGRHNIVLTRDIDKYKDDICDNLEFENDFSKLLTSIKDSQIEYFVIGGEQIYKMFLPYSERLYITEIDSDKEADSHFEFNKEEFEIEEFEERTSNDGLVYKFVNYKRKTLT